MDLEKAFVRVSNKVLGWAMRKKGMPEVLVRSVMGLYEGAKTKVRVDYELSEEFEVTVGMHQGSVLSPFCFAVAANVVIGLLMQVVFGELPYADDLFLMSGSIEGLKSK